MICTLDSPDGLLELPRDAGVPQCSKKPLMPELLINYAVSVQMPFPPFYSRACWIIASFCLDQLANSMLFVVSCFVS